MNLFKPKRTFESVVRELVAGLEEGTIVLNNKTDGAKAKQHEDGSLPPRVKEIAMNELTLESLAKRVAALENALAAQGAKRPPKDWRKVVGMFHDSEFMRAVDDECLRLRELERETANREEPLE